MSATSSGGRLAAVPALLVVALVAAGLVSPLAASRDRDSSASEPAPSVNLPARARHDRPAAAPRRQPPAIEGVVTRGGDRVHVSMGPGRPEWLFCRNPRDGRRVTAILFDRAARVLVEYDESELAMAGIAQGWADVASLPTRGSGGDAHLLADPRADGTAYRVIDVADYREATHGPS